MWISFNRLAQIVQNNQMLPYHCTTMLDARESAGFIKEEGSFQSTGIYMYSRD